MTNDTKVLLGCLDYPQAISRDFFEVGENRDELRCR